MDPTYPLVPIANFLACILVLSSMSKSMIQSWNVGACSFAIWVIIMALTVAVNAIIWADNVNNVAPVWCDIGKWKSKYYSEIQGADRSKPESYTSPSWITGCCPCLFIGNCSEALHYFASMRLFVNETSLWYYIEHTNSHSYHAQRFDFLFDLSLCMGLPVVLMALCEFIRIIP